MDEISHQMDQAHHISLWRTSGGHKPWLKYYLVLNAVNDTHQCQLFKPLTVHCQAYKTLKTISPTQPVKINNIQQVTVYYTVLFRHLLTF